MVVNPAGITQNSGISTGYLSVSEMNAKGYYTDLQSHKKIWEISWKWTALSLVGYQERIQLRLLREESLGTKHFPPLSGSQAAQICSAREHGAEAM